MPTHERPPRNRGQQPTARTSSASNRTRVPSRTSGGGGGNGSGNGGNRNRNRNSGLQRPKRKWTWKKTWWLLFFTVAIAIFAAVGGYLFILLNGERLMKEYKDADMLQLAEASTILDRHGNEIAKIGTSESNREVVEADEIPEMLADAFIATEDQRFWTHSGVDLWSIGRAMVKDIMAGSMVEGGSTITQQLAKNMFLTSDKTLFRKATEVSIALALENHFTKKEIITMYLNRIYFGKGAYGVKAAANKYFGVSDLNDLEIWQMATLAAIPKAPSHYNPISNPEKSKGRRAVVLKLMYDQGYITMAEMEEAKAIDYEPIHTGDEGESGKTTNNAPYQSFIDYMIQEVEDTTGLSEDQLYRGGYTITTTMDSNAQNVMYQQYNNDSNFEESKDEVKSQSSMVITDHSSGAIIAMIGGRDYERKGLNRVTVKRQPGSSFKPIVSYAPAVETGEWFPWSTLRDDKECFGDYCPTDLGSNKYVGAIDMETALKKSTNLPAVWLLNEIGLKTGYEFAEKLGITFAEDKKDYNLSLALGGMTEGVTPIEMAEAYNTFANGGNYYPSYTIKQIADRNDKVVFSYSIPKPQRVMSEQTAYYMTQMMQEVVNSGTGTKAQMNRPVAGKTGSTQHSVPGYSGSGSRDFWFVGYTPEWTAAVWMGYDKTDKDHVLLGSSGQPAALFSKIMSEALKGIEQKQFPKPGGVKEEEVQKPNDTVSGLQASYSEDTKTVSLQWNAASGDDVVYHLYRKSSSDEQYVKLLSDLQVTNAEDIGVFAGQTYTYYVTSSSKDNPDESARSNEVSVTIPAEEGPEIPTEPVEPPEETPDTPGTPSTPEQPEGPSQGETPSVPDSDNSNGGTVDNPDQNGGNQTPSDDEQSTPSNGPAQEDMPTNQDENGVGTQGNGTGYGNGNGNNLGNAA